MVGSIGVVAGVPNVHRLLEKGGVEFVQRTAGQYMRTINALTPNTEVRLTNGRPQRYVRYVDQRSLEALRMFEQGRYLYV